MLTNHQSYFSLGVSDCARYHLLLPALLSDPSSTGELCLRYNLPRRPPLNHALLLIPPPRSIADHKFLSTRRSPIFLFDQAI